MSKENAQSKAPQGVCSTDLLDALYAAAAASYDPQGEDGDILVTLHYRTSDAHHAKIVLDNASNADLSGGIPSAPNSCSSCSALALARQFHDTYERLAPSHGYETRPDTRDFDPDSPNGRLMTAVCKEILKQNANVDFQKGARSAE